ncbi:MAG: hypothetical protein IJT23_00880 [Clostridia bacterium]|nr:hypothetical protein [Clostridia bacterium]
MNFSSYPLYVGNDIDKKEFDGYGDWVELKSDSKNPSWSVSDESIIRLKEVDKSRAVVEAIRTGFAHVFAVSEDGKKEDCQISVIDNYTRRTVGGIEFNFDTIHLAPDMSADIIPIFYPKDVYNNGMLDTTLICKSTDESVAVVKDGKVYATGEGKTKVLVTSYDVGRCSEFNVCVSKNVKKHSIKADYKTVPTVNVGESIKLDVKSKSEIIWKSDNRYIADVDEFGVVYGYSNSNTQLVSADGISVSERWGTVKIYATAKDGGEVCAFNVCVLDAPITVHNVTINRHEISIPVGNEGFLEAVITPASIMEKSVIWSSSDDSILTVKKAENAKDGSNRAVIKAINKGTVTVTVQYGDKFDVCNVTVSDSVINVAKISADESRELEIDEVIKLNAKVLDNATDKRLIWIGTNDDIATVDRDGNVKGYHKGEILAYVFSADSISDTQLQELKEIKRAGKRFFTDEDFKPYLNTYAVCKIRVKETSPYLRNLHIPNETITHNSINLLWNSASKTDMPNFKEYAVKCNGKEIARVNTLGYTVNNLKSNTSYEFVVLALDKDENVLSQKAIKTKTKAEPHIINVLDCGAKGDGRAMDTYAIQSAIDNCPKGGIVLLPQNHIFLSGALFVKSDMTLEVDGILLGSSNPKDYPRIITRWEGWRKLRIPEGEWENSETDPERPYKLSSDYQHASLINIGTYYEGEAGTISQCNVQNVCICGKGQINGNGFALAYNEGPNWKHKKNPKFYRAEPPVQNPGFRGRTLAMNNADGVYVKDVQIAYAPSWTTHFIFCNHVTFDNVSVISQGHGNAGYGTDIHNCVHIYNGDGIDPEDCTYVNIFNSYFRTGDDTVTLKAGRNKEGNELDKPNAYIRITDCTCSWSLGGFGVGSEDASGAHDILYQNLSVHDGEIFGYWFKTCPERGSLTENIIMRDCMAEGVRAVLVFSHEYSKSGRVNPAKHTPIHRHFTIENISGSGDEYSMRFNGLKPGSIHSITVRGTDFYGSKEIDITKCDSDAVKFI